MTVEDDAGDTEYEDIFDRRQIEGIAAGDSGRAFAVAVCEPNLPDSGWFDFLERLAELTQPPAVIVASRLADNYLWSEVLNVGGFDVLPKQFGRSELSQAVAAAWEDRSRERGASSGVTVSAGPLRAGNVADQDIGLVSRLETRESPSARNRAPSS